MSFTFNKALIIGRPPNIVKLFPNSKALIVSGKVIDRALLEKGSAMTIAANGRNYLIIRGVLMAAQKANAAIIIEIAKSEGGISGYCAVNYWNIARYIDILMNEMAITVPVAIHADHYTIKSTEDIRTAKIEIPSMFEAGITSIAVDASYLSDAENLLANIYINSLIPKWVGLETEVGEIKGKQGLSTLDEALFLIKGLNAYSIFPDWIAINNGTVHGIQSADYIIDLELTKLIHKGLSSYYISGAQHGTSGNNLALLYSIARETKTTKANIATALQMISWGLKVNEYGNAILDEGGDFIKLFGKGVTDYLWKKMKNYAQWHNFNNNDYKKLNLPFENYLLSQPKIIRERIVNDISDFVYNLLYRVFNAGDTASIALDIILKTGSYNLGSKAECIENREDWTKNKIYKKALVI